MYDFIGDIHGYDEKLEQLLQKLGYQKEQGVYEHPGRKVVFLGDWIDRGPGIPQVLAIVRSMYQAGNALACLGNHEYNALCYATNGPAGEPLRKHSAKNIKQHADTIDSFAHDPALWQSYLDWFMQLPLFLELDGCRGVHATWAQNHIDYLKERLPEGHLNLEFLYQSAQKGTPEYCAVEDVLKGVEIALPSRSFMENDEGFRRYSIRAKWWEPLAGKTYADVVLSPFGTLPDVVVPKKMAESIQLYTHDAPPVFFGHYWFKGTPAPVKHNIACLDYSVGKGGLLAAYRWDGEQQLSANKFVWV